MARLAVIHLTYSWPPMGGATVDIHELLIRAQQDYELKLFVPRFPRGFSRCDIASAQPYPIERIPFTPMTFNYRTIGGRFRGTVEEFKPDLVFIADGWHLKPWLFKAFADLTPLLRVYTHENLCLLRNGILYRNSTVCPFNFLENPKQCRWCMLSHNLGAFWYRTEALTSLSFTAQYHRVTLEMFSKARTIIVYNQFTKELLKPVTERVLVIPSGVDADRFVVRSEPANNPLVLLAPGRMADPCKGLSLLLTALDRLGTDGRRVELWVTGAVKERRPYLKKLGWVPPESMPKLYAQADIVVVPPVWPEPQGIVVLEACATGRPVVATAVGGIPDMIRNEHNGLLCEPTVESLAAALAAVIDSADLRKRLGTQARVTVEQRYTWELIYQRSYRPLFSEQMSSRSSGEWC